MKNRLKHFRVVAGMTQTRVADAVDVSQPTYQRWEIGYAHIPEAKLSKLANCLRTTSEALLGRHPPLYAVVNDRCAPEHLQYYGKMVVHFHSNDRPLSLSISEGARDELYDDLSYSSKFITVNDLGNRTVVIRKSAISDINVSRDAYETFNPDHKVKSSLHIWPDPRDWEIVECLARDNYGIEDFAEEDVKRVKSVLTITDQEFEEMVADGAIKPDELEAVKDRFQAAVSETYRRSTDVFYQMSNGIRQSIDIQDFDLFEAFRGLIEAPEDPDPEMILLGDYGRSVYINPNALDHISIPSHRLEKNLDDALASFLDDLDASERAERLRGSQKVVPIAKRSRKTKSGGA